MPPDTPTGLQLSWSMQETNIQNKVTSLQDNNTIDDRIN